MNSPKGRKTRKWLTVFSNFGGVWAAKKRRKKSNSHINLFEVIFNAIVEKNQYSIIISLFCPPHNHRWRNKQQQKAEEENTNFSPEHPRKFYRPHRRTSMLVHIFQSFISHTLMMINGVFLWIRKVREWSQYLLWGRIIEGNSVNMKSLPKSFPTPSSQCVTWAAITPKSLFFFRKTTFSTHCLHQISFSVIVKASHFFLFINPFKRCSILERHSLKQSRLIVKAEGEKDLHANLFIDVGAREMIQFTLVGATGWRMIKRKKSHGNFLASSKDLLCSA